MSGRTATEVLRNRFDTIRESELARLSKKLSQLAPDDRRSVEAIAADVVRALARLPERALLEDESQDDVNALAKLFSLDS